MDLNYTDEELTFADEVRAFCEKVPQDVRDRVKRNDHISKQDYVDYHKLLYEAGWAVPNWEKEHGGTDWTPMMHHIFEEVSTEYGLPRKIPFGVTMVGPVIAKFGNQTQKDTYLPRIARFDDWWCQGFSEPGAGSDLASLKCSAVRDGNHYIVNGEKTWTTLGQYANMIFMLVRTDTDAKQQEGISFLLIDMNSPGVSVKPIFLIDGSHEVNSIFFDDVKVPVENLVGEENKGWSYAKYLLAHERNNIAQVGYAKQQIKLLKSIAANENAADKPLLNTHTFRRKLAEVEIDVKTLEVNVLRSMSDPDKVTDLTVAGMLKIRGSEISQQISRLIMEAAGPAAMINQTTARESGSNVPVLGPDYLVSAAPHYYNFRKTSIYGGSNEVQHAIISKALLTQ